MFSGSRSRLAVFSVFPRFDYCSLLYVAEYVYLRLVTSYRVIALHVYNGIRACLLRYSWVYKLRVAEALLSLQCDSFNSSNNWQLTY